MDSASLEHLLRRGDAKVRRQGATHAATRYDEYDGLCSVCSVCSVCSDSNAASCVFIVYVKSPPEPLPPSSVCSVCSVCSVWRIGVCEIAANACIFFLSFSMCVYVFMCLCSSWAKVRPSRIMFRLEYVKSPPEPLPRAVCAVCAVCECVQCVAYWRM